MSTRVESEPGVQHADAGLAALTQSNPFSKAVSTLLSLLQGLFRSKGFLALCDQGVISLGNFLTGLALGRLVGKAELGIYALCWTIVTLTVDLSGAITTTPYTVFGPHLRVSERSRYVGNMFSLHCALTVVVALIVALGDIIFGRQLAGGGVFPALLATASVIVFLNGREFVRRICFADMAVGLALVLDVVFTSLHLAGLLLLWRRGALNPAATYLLLGAVGLGQTATWVFIYRRKLIIGRGWWSEALRNWHFAKWLLGSTLLWTIATYFYPWLLTAYHGTMSTGLWASCSAIVAVGNPVLGGLVNYIGPKLSALYAQFGLASMRGYVYKCSLFLVLLLSPFALGLSLWGNRIMTALYGPAYSETHTILILLSLNLLALSFSHPYARGLATLGAPKVDMLVNVLALLLLFSVGIATVKYFSVTGAASALLLSTCATAVLRLWAFTRTAAKAGSPETFRSTQMRAFDS